MMAGTRGRHSCSQKALRQRFLFQMLHIFWGDRGHVFAKVSSEAIDRQDAGSSS